MRPYGSKRTFCGCSTRRKPGGKVHVTEYVTRRRRDRAAAKLAARLAVRNPQRHL